MSKKYYYKNKEKILEQKKIYYQENAEDIKKYKRDYYHANLEKMKNLKKNQRKKEPWKFHLYAIKTRCNNKNVPHYKYYGGRGIKCLITAEELKEIWFRDKAYEMQKPEIDRTDNDGHYEYDNCRFIEKSKNIANRNRLVSTKSVLQYNLEGKFIKKFKSITEASILTKTCLTSISKCCNNNQKSTNGFIWKFQSLN